MINIGINGFGRIGKCVFLQLINNNNYSIKCLNAMNININEIEDYLTYDTTHKHNLNIKVIILNENTFKINHHLIKLISERDAKQINWKQYDCEYIIDATGSYLTTEKCKDHNVKYIVMSSPAKDKTNTFIYGVNNDLYKGESVISGSSCTTNCIAPILKILNDNYKISNCVFTTIHATTASQYVVDTLQKSSRTNRSIFNNIIPHTTGASSSIISVLPELKGKINGTSIRVPVVNCSLVDLNIELEDKNITLKDISNLLKNSPYYKTVFDISSKKLVSCDFITTETPTILDTNASIDMGNGKFKLMIWYDNEWSYSSQLIRLVDIMHQHNKNKSTINEQKYYIENIQIENKGVVCRFDLNVPIDKFGNVTDYFRIESIIPTINNIISKNPKYIVLTSHFGRPKGKEEKYSLKFLVPILEKYINTSINFLEYGISSSTLLQIEKVPTGIYLLENLRFHDEETNYEKGLLDNTLVNIYKELGDIFICDAFGCAHRKHLSICAIQHFEKPYGYGYLIKKELDAINNLINNSNKKILGIVGGAKIKDKLPIIESLKKITNSSIYIAGALAKQYVPQQANEFIMYDGFGASSLEDNSTYINSIKNSELNVYDIGDSSLNNLKRLIDESDIIFWNGSLGVIEHNEYCKGSLKLLEYLYKQTHKQIIIGGGETASLINNDLKQKHQSFEHIYISTGGGALLEYLQNKLLYNTTLIGLDSFSH